MLKMTYLSNNKNIAEPPRNRQKQRKGGLIYESEINDTV